MWRGLILSLLLPSLSLAADFKDADQLYGYDSQGVFQFFQTWEDHKDQLAAELNITSGGANVQADWTELDTAEDSHILNKPDLGAAALLDATNGVIGDVVVWIDDGDGNAALPIASITEIASGTATLGVAEIASAACATAVTVEATGVLTTDTIGWSFNADVAASASFVPAANIVIAYPTADNVNFRVCNETAGAYTPPAGTLNWQVLRQLAPIGD